MKRDRKEYLKYLNSQEWGRLRLDALAQHGDRCTTCPSYLNIQLHHLFYPENIWETKVDHVIPLCKACHDRAHDMPSKPYTFELSELPAKRSYVVTALKLPGIPKNPFSQYEANKRLAAELKERAAKHGRLLRHLRQQERNRKLLLPFQEAERLRRIAESFRPNLLKGVKPQSFGAALVRALFIPEPRVSKPQCQKLPPEVKRARRAAKREREAEWQEAKRQLLACGNPTHFVFTPPSRSAMA
jgi:hypothetical protein